MQVRWVAMLTCVMSALVAGCAIQPPLLHHISEYAPDGTVVSRTKTELSTFEQLADNWAPRKPGTGGAVDEMFAMEADVPDGPGDAGGYLVVYRNANHAELRYFEQSDHQPRLDRYYHRPLTSPELTELQQFVATYSASDLSQSHPAATAPAAQGAAGKGGESGIVFRWMYARPKLAYAVTMPGLALDAHPGGDLVLLLVKLRDAAPLECTYMMRVPTTAHLLFASPFKEVRKVWVGPGDGGATEVRAEIFPPLDLAPGVPADPAVEQWYAYRAGAWSPCALPPPPPPATTAPATAPLTIDVPATGPAASRFSVSGLLPTQESWLAEPMDGFTRVQHIMPENAFTARIKTFDVPGLVFDQAHMVVSGKQMYLIHSGHLFVLDLPAAAFAQP